MNKKISLIILSVFISGCMNIKSANVNDKSMIISDNQWLTKDQKTFKYKSWVKSSDPKAVIIAVHGISGASSDFDPLGQYFENKNFNIYAVDERGQGNDPDKLRRGDIDSYKLWVNDLYDFTELVSKKNPNKPIFYYAESLGVLITGNMLLEKKVDNLKGVIFASPVIKLEGEISWWQNLLFKAMILIKPTHKISFSDFDNGNTDKEKQRISRDNQYQESLTKMPHYLDGFTLRFLQNIMIMMENINKNTNQLNQNILILYAGKDIFTKPVYIDSFFEKIASNQKEKILFPESYHLLLHDYDKDKVLSYLENWLNKELK